MKPSGGGKSTIFHRFLDQERTPVFTTISLLTTVFVLFVMILVPSFTYRDWGAPAAYIFTLLVVVFGAAANIIVGFCASVRGEYCGGRIAAMGMALWLVTGVVLSAIR